MTQKSPIKIDLEQALMQEVSAAHDGSSLLRTIIAYFHADTSLSLLIGAEIEFYLSFPEETDIAPLLVAIHSACAKLPVIVGEVEKEKGTGQYEIQLSPLSDPLMMAMSIAEARDIIHTTALAFQAEASFTAKPYPDQPGSGLHIHINLFDNTGRNCFQKEGEQEPALLLHAIGGLCASLPEAMAFLSPNEPSYRRFVPHLDAPTTISWGGNNRTTALRLPTSSPENRRIEHRVASAESDPYLVIAAILAGMHYGITHHITPPPRIYGNAFDPQYALPLLPANLAEAQQAYHQGKILRTHPGFHYLCIERENPLVPAMPYQHHHPKT